MRSRTKHPSNLMTLPQIQTEVTSSALGVQGIQENMVIGQQYVMVGTASAAIAASGTSYQSPNEE